MDGNNRWQDMFDPHGQRGGPPPGSAAPMSASAAMPCDAPPDDDGLALDLSVYRPWTIERGVSRSVMMIDFRRYDPRSGLWTGWAMSYPHLVSIEYTGDRLVSLNFGHEQILVEGEKLDELVTHLKRGVVTSAQQYCPTLWPGLEFPALIRSMRRVDAARKDFT